MTSAAFVSGALYFFRITPGSLYFPVVSQTEDWRTIEMEDNKQLGRVVTSFALRPDIHARIKQITRERAAQERRNVPMYEVIEKALEVAFPEKK